MNRNEFIKKFQYKTDSELTYILENKKSYTEKAIAASVHILNERNVKFAKLNSVNPVEVKKENKEIVQKKIIKEEKKKRRKEYYANKLLGIGIACIGCAFYFFAPTLFTSEKSLIETSGKVENVKAFYTKVSSRGHKSVKSELILNLQNDKRNYKLFKNIEQSRFNEKFELIEKELKKSGKAIIWIKKNEKLDMEPTVFQIATGEGNILYDLDDVKSELKFLFPFLIMVGFFGIGIYINHKYPNQIKNLIRKKTSAQQRI